MKIEVINGALIETLCDTLIITLFEGDKGLPAGSTASLADRALNGHINRIIQGLPAAGKYGETTVIYTLGMISAERIILLGAGKKADFTLEKARALMAIALRKANKLRAKRVAASISDIVGSGVADSRAMAQGVVEGAIMGLYQFKCYKSGNNDVHNIEQLLIVEAGAGNITAINKGAELGKIVAASVNYARDLINHPAQYMTPAKMARQAEKLARQYGLEISLLEQEDMQQQGMGALLAVARGSSEPPKLIVLKYMGDPASQEIIAYVGKGITFDSGGISIKPSQNMDEMKRDMAGGGAVIGAMMAIGQLKPKVNIVAVVPCTENMPSGSAYRPGDIITSMSGKTIEVLNTDAEGRLILADAVSYAKKIGATKIIDLATLTGACVVGLGTVYSGVITNDSEWCRRIMAAARQAGEKMWELPNDEEYLEQIKSSIADLKNSGGRAAGTITAGLFIGQFADPTPWVHIDIAGTSDADKTKGYNLKGGTGAGVRTLIQLATHLGGL
ncbi:leucyl aminopeptidase [Sporomusa termitida]|uniref:Probable cytosol aminopeptidase n=1 Tax=Sporomusa termitida TaxID=2377 RepID=A0A517DTB7_9FIRM|nr:leucyl aminopeptidase [Sporomusa termitida]QDR80589.1 Cytosol aminopeptidase [Sporomusa termitida]